MKIYPAADRCLIVSEPKPCEHHEIRNKKGALHCFGAPHNGKCVRGKTMAIGDESCGRRFSANWAQMRLGWRGSRVATPLPRWVERRAPAAAAA